MHGSAHIKNQSTFAPDDFTRVLEWFPLAEVEIIRATGKGR